jgi:hypothetical protein
MNFLSSITKRRAVGLAGACALALSGIAGATIAGAGPADAATCLVGAPCAITGSADLGAGVLSATVPNSLAWTAALSGSNQNVVDLTTADLGYTVDDALSTAVGWHVTVSATTFTCTTTSTPVSCATTQTLPNATTFSTNGSTGLATDTTVPSANCTVATTPADCTLPTNSITFPVAITTAATTPTAFTIYNAAAGTGVGSVDIGQTTGNPAATNPVGWWIHVPGTTLPGSYTSTITVNVISGPA